jgi:uncharacterized DUF497 family protein
LCRFSTLTVPFEYNLDKSRANLQKHGIDFEQAQELWNDAKAIGI